jgi:protein-S-isoprenylcysteine O-methyltransferase Ste14
MEIFFKITVGLLILLTNIIRGYYQNIYKTTHADKKTVKAPLREKILVAYVGISFFIPGLLWLFTDFTSFSAFPLPLWLRFVGLATGAYSIYYFYWVHKTLGNNWSPVLEIRKNHELVIKGPYTHVRHPMYFSMLLMIVGMNTAMCNGLFLGSSVVCFVVLCMVRLGDEEKLMLQEFGKAYQDYMNTSKRLIPFIY